MLHADPHPGNFRVLPTEDGVAGRARRRRLRRRGPAARASSLPRTHRRADPDRDCTTTTTTCSSGLRDEGFVKPNITHRPGRAARLPRPVRRAGPRGDVRVLPRLDARAVPADPGPPRSPGSTLALRLNLPPAYLLIHRVWVGGIGVLCQLEAELPFRQILDGARCPGSPTPEPLRRLPPLAVELALDRAQVLARARRRRTPGTGRSPPRWSRSAAGRRPAPSCRRSRR